MSHIMEDHRRRLVKAIDNIFDPDLKPSKTLFMANAYIAQRRNDPDPDCFDRRMNAYLRAMETLLIAPTTRFDIHQLQIQTMENMLPFVAHHDIVVEEPATHAPLGTSLPEGCDRSRRLPPDQPGLTYPSFCTPLYRGPDPS